MQSASPPPLSDLEQTMLHITDNIGPLSPPNPRTSVQQRREKREVKRALSAPRPRRMADRRPSQASSEHASLDQVQAFEPTDKLQWIAMQEQRWNKAQSEKAAGCHDACSEPSYAKIHAQDHRGSAPGGPFLRRNKETGETSSQEGRPQRASSAGSAVARMLARYNAFS
jgi:hypothetical protein